MSPRYRVRRRDDPGPAWADRALAPLRGQEARVDVTAAVMRRIAGQAPAPAWTPLPAGWSQVAWAAALFAGFVVLAILVSTAGAMVLGGDEGVGQVLTLGAAFGRLASRGFGLAATVLAALAAAGVALLKGTWGLVDPYSPLIRQGILAGALSGLVSIGISFIVVSRARRAAPAASGSGNDITHGGLS